MPFNYHHYYKITVSRMYCAWYISSIYIHIYVSDFWKCIISSRNIFEIKVLYSIYIIISQNIRYLLWNRGLIEQYLPNISDPVYSVHQSFMWFLWLNWRKSTFYPITAPKDSKSWPIVTSSILEPTASKLWRHNDRFFRRGCYGCFLSTTNASDELCTCLVLNWSGVWQSD